MERLWGGGGGSSLIPREKSGRDWGGQVSPVTSLGGIRQEWKGIVLLEIARLLLGRSRGGTGEEAGAAWSFWGAQLRRGLGHWAPGRSEEAAAHMG